MMVLKINKVKILLDADVLIHLFKAEKISLLQQLFPKRLIMLDIVLNELRSNTHINKSLDSIFIFSGIEEVMFPTSSNKALLFEFILLKKQIGGAGESATLLYCKHNAHIIASSNTKDIVPYCTANGMAYLTTLDIFAIAVQRKIMTEAEVNSCITVINNSNSHLWYDASKQYPMIVKIYEKKSKGLHRYSRQTLLSNEGDVLSNSTASGYFVLYPDLELELGNPGISATDCVVAAVKAATLKASIDPKKIGLIGHSYGGYETNFIITQTDIFAAAVAGAGISDTIGRYFGLAFNLYNTDMWRYESQQWRMGTSFFANKQSYWNNSPVMNADTIKTPLLLWHGKLDDTIPYDQCVSFYLALRRLGLQTIMLAYPDEGHAIEKPQNQLDLTRRIIQWFDYFLKDKTDVGWITNGTTAE